MSKASAKRAQRMTEEMARSLVGRVVEKFSGKPFKSGLKTATVRDVVSHQQKPGGGLAFAFVEDDSVVAVEMCKPLAEVAS